MTVKCINRSKCAVLPSKLRIAAGFATASHYYRTTNSYRDQSTSS